MKPNKFFQCKCTADSFYRAWLEFLTPYHKLTAREKDVAARIMTQYFKIRNTTSDPEMVKAVLWTKESRGDMMRSLGMSQEHFQIVLAKLRRAGVLVDGGINPKFIPDKTDNPFFVLEIVFDWSSKSNPVRNVS